MKSGNIRMISKVMIRPSSPTPDSLKTFKLSYLDQLVPPIYVPVIFFYRPNELTCKSDQSQTSQKLKKSLSEALTSFPPLAGRFHPQNFTVDCNDAGADFIEARVHGRLSDTIQDPKIEQLNQYLPVDPNTMINISGEEPPPVLLAVQINFFDCGGIAIGVCSSHYITDATSLVAFMGTWAAAFRGEKEKISPATFDLSHHFPARDLSTSGFSPCVYVKKENLVTKRFAFNEEKLSTLKEAATAAAGSTVKDPTRVELVTAFIWKHFMETMDQSNNLTCAAWHVVNLRTRASLPLEYVFGNCILKQFFPPGGPEFHELVNELRKGIRTIRDEYILEARNGDDYLNDISKYFDLISKGDIEACGFTSWCGFPVYDVDYGWGKPDWVCPTSCPEKNVTFLMSTKDGDGIEAWINMLESNSESLENKFKLLESKKIFD